MSVLHSLTLINPGFIVGVAISISSSAQNEGELWMNFGFNTRSALVYIKILSHLFHSVQMEDNPMKGGEAYLMFCGDAQRDL